MSMEHFVVYIPEEPPIPPHESILYMYPVETVIRTKDGNYWEITDLYNHDGDRYFKVAERPKKGRR